jgi:hypothetical protein
MAGSFQAKIPQTLQWFSKQRAQKFGQLANYIHNSFQFK